MQTRAHRPSAVVALFFAVLSAACDDEPTAPPSPAKTGLPPARTARPVARPSDLLYDNALRTPPDPAAVPVAPAFVDWILANHAPLRSLSSSDFSDLEFLAPLIGSRRLVQLGESGHGVAEFNRAKVRLIRYLHERLGFDVIAFESSIYECFAADRDVGVLAPAEVMRRSIFGVWHTEEVVPLFAYLESARRTSRPLMLAGFDVQISSIRGVRGRPRFLHDVVARVDPSMAAQVQLQDSIFVSRSTGGFSAFQEFVRTEGDAYAAFYAALAMFLSDNAAALQAAFATEPMVPRIARRIAVSMPAFIEEIQFLQSDIRRSYIARDRGMADNVSALLQDLYPDRKIIVWAHNFHIAHRNAYVTGDMLNVPTMGTWVAERHRDELYTIGLFMYRGAAAWNNRTLYTLAPPARGSVESILYSVRRRHIFADLLHQEQADGNAWMFQLVPAKSWGVYDYYMVPRDQFDALLFVDTVTPPDYYQSTIAAWQPQPGPVAGALDAR